MYLVQSLSEIGYKNCVKTFTIIYHALQEECALENILAADVVHLKEFFIDIDCKFYDMDRACADQ